MTDVTPLAPLVLMVQPDIAAAWARLAPDAQVYWSSMLVHGWLRYILTPRGEPGRPSPVREAISAMSLEELRTLVAELERTLVSGLPLPEAPAP